MNNNKLTDEEIVIKVTNGEKDLYTELVKRYEGALGRYINYLSAGNIHTDDILQETFIKAYINLNSFNTNKKFSSWIYRIAHNEAINKFRKESRFIHLDIHELFSIRCREPSIEEEFEKSELKLKIRNCIESLNVKYTEVLVLFYLEDKSYEEISDILRIPKSTVGVRIKRAKEQLSKICKKKGINND